MKKILLTGISVSLSAGKIEDYKKACDSGDFHVNCIVIPVPHSLSFMSNGQV